MIGRMKSQTVQAMRACGARLWRDTAGNALAIAASTIFLLIALTGSGTDLTRSYMTRTALQNACDSGVLAGRKAMSKSGSYSTAETAKAKKMFNFNFNPLPTEANNTTFVTSADTQGAVNGVATTQMPMVVMGLFGFQTVTLSVSCSAELQMASADVMFVLDTTGSMAYDVTNTTCCNRSDSKIVGLRSAVSSFYKTVAGAVTDKTNTRIRFAFVPYSSTVNIKTLVSSGAMPTSYLASSADFQTRLANFSTPVTVSNSPTSPGPVTETYASAISSANCTNYGKNTYPSGSGGTPINGGGPSPAATTVTTYAWLSWVQTGTSGKTAIGTCKRTKTVTTTTYKTLYNFTNWSYTKKSSIDVSAFKGLGAVSLFTSFNAGATVPTSGPKDRVELAKLVGQTDVSGLNTSSYTWNGCIEERATVQQLSMSPVPSGAYDLDLDSAPTSDPKTQWKMYLEPLEWYRGTGTSTWTTWDVTDSDLTTKYNSASYTSPQAAYCPAPMAQYTTVDVSDPATVPSWLTTYLNSLSASGATYHDLGMIWGGRLGSPNGIFASNVNADATKFPSVSRHVIFMTDGTMEPTSTIYNAYGTEWYDNRIAPYNATSGSTGTLATYHNNRFLAACDKLKAMGYTIWVIGFGQSLTTPMQTCSTANRAYYASNTTELTNTFKYIAGQVADLRIKK